MQVELREAVSARGFGNICVSAQERTMQHLKLEDLPGECSWN